MADRDRGGGGPRVLLVWPEIPPTTYWSFTRSLGMIGKKANLPPLGLITVAAMLPRHWRLRLVDETVRPLTDDDLAWADALFVSAMIVQRESLDVVVRRAREAAVPVIAGGPYPSTCYDRLPGVDHFVIGEAEEVLPAFLADWRDGRGRARRAYARPAETWEADELTAAFGRDADVRLCGERPSLERTPVPRFDLLDRDAYKAMAVQFSRGCPVGCEFCDIWTRLGRRPRLKPVAAMLRELDALDALGWRGTLFFVDDNFVGNVRRSKELLEALQAWQREHGYPFTLFTEVSLRLAERPDLLRLMKACAFDMVFIGIETPSQGSLAETGKRINRVADVAEQVAAIQRHGIEVTAGFIVGFDSDPDDIAERMVDFVQELGIPLAMVGLLMAPPQSALERRMRAEGRLLDQEFTGNNTHDFGTNIRPLIGMEALVARYRSILRGLYSPSLRSYFRRCATLRRRWVPNPHAVWHFSWPELRGALRSLVVLGVRRCGPAYWWFLLTSLLRRPRFVPVGFRLGIQGLHLRDITIGALELERFREFLGELRARYGRAIDEEGAALRRRLDAFVAEASLRWDAIRSQVDWGEDEAIDGGHVMRAVTELQRLTQEQIDALSPAVREQVDTLLHRYEVLRQQVVEHVDRLEGIKGELILEARRRRVRLSRDYERTLAAMRTSFADELDRLTIGLDATLALPPPPRP